MSALSKEEEEQHVQYLSAKGVSKLLDEVVHECCVRRPADPRSFVAAYLRTHGRRRHPKETTQEYAKSSGGIQTATIASLRGPDRDPTANPDWLEDDARHRVVGGNTAALIRGNLAVYPQDTLNRPGFWEQLAQGLAVFFVSRKSDALHTVFVAGDSRRGNREAAQLLAKTFVGNGLRVLLPQSVATTFPSAVLTVGSTEHCIGAVYLTAASLPAQYSGYRIHLAKKLRAPGGGSSGAPKPTVSPKLSPPLATFAPLMPKPLQSSFGAPGLPAAQPKDWQRCSPSEELAEAITLQEAASAWTAVSDETAARYEGLIDEVDSVGGYAEFLDSVFDFAGMRDAMADKTGLRIALDCMHGAAGPVAREVFVNRLAFEEGVSLTLLREVPREDLGGVLSIPDADLRQLRELRDLNGSQQYALASAFDAEGARRVSGGKALWIEPGDEFCVFALHARLLLLPQQPAARARGAAGASAFSFSRSVLASHAIDRVVAVAVPQAKPVVCLSPGAAVPDSPNAWAVDDAGGLSNPRLGENDAVFATVFLLKLLLDKRVTVKGLLEELWEKHGRVYVTRGEIRGSAESEREQLVSILESIGKPGSASSGRESDSLALAKAERWVPKPDKAARSGAATDPPPAWILTFAGDGVVKLAFAPLATPHWCLQVHCATHNTDHRLHPSDVTQGMKDAFLGLLTSNGWSGQPPSNFTDALAGDPYACE
ncbi:Phosphoglucomutase [Diplonema papillatum]|nr:Phosphoglucomutase [Diplonema papillatum]KAJ9447757.1 Phosphoglucomutase [Diplonema papillatum]